MQKRNLCKTIWLYLQNKAFFKSIINKINKIQNKQSKKARTYNSFIFSFFFQGANAS